jgi:hypothetical protein
VAVPHDAPSQVVWAHIRASASRCPDPAHASGMSCMNGHDVPSEQRFCGECGVEVVPGESGRNRWAAQEARPVREATPHRVLPPPKAERAVHNPVQHWDLFTKVALASIGATAVFFGVVAFAMAQGSSAGLADPEKNPTAPVAQPVETQPEETQPTQPRAGDLHRQQVSDCEVQSVAMNGGQQLSEAQLIACLTLP